MIDVLFLIIIRQVIIRSNKLEVVQKWLVKVLYKTLYK